MRRLLIFRQPQFPLYRQELYHVVHHHQLVGQTGAMEVLSSLNPDQHGKRRLELKTTKPCAGFPYAGPGLGGNLSVTR